MAKRTEPRVKYPEPRKAAARELDEAVSRTREVLAHCGDEYGDDDTACNVAGRDMAGERIQRLLENQLLILNYLRARLI